MMARRVAGRLGCGGGVSTLFFPLCDAEAVMLEEGVGDHCHEGVAVKPLPGSSFEVIKPKLFLELLMGLFADPARLDGAGECLDRRVCRQVREVVFAFPTGATFADQPGLVARHVLAAQGVDALRRPVSDPYPQSGKASRQTPLRAATPGERAPCCACQHYLCREGLAVRDVPLSRATAASNREDQRDIDRIDLLMARDADSPMQATFTECVPECCAQAIAGISQHTSEAHAGGSEGLNVRTSRNHEAQLSSRFRRSRFFDS
jgi:hypothetical protein